jgi:glycerophosphoryl diester phosphodiesterase
VPTRLPARRSPPIGFAHRGARAHARENTLESFLLARRLGATGLESDVWVTSDGEVVLDHDGVVGRVRKRPLSGVQRAPLPSHIPTLEDLYLACGTDFSLPSTSNPLPSAVVATRSAMERPTVYGSAITTGASSRRGETSIRYRARRLDALRSMGGAKAAQLADAGIDAVNLHVSDWSGGLTTLFHRFERCVAWDA